MLYTYLLAELAAAARRAELLVMVVYSRVCRTRLQGSWIYVHGGMLSQALEGLMKCGWGPAHEPSE